MKFMRILLFILFVATGLPAKTQTTDTIFLKRVIADTPYPFYNAIYIDIQKTDPDFGFSKFDSVTYARDIKDLEPLHRSGSLPKDLPRKWILLYQYQHAYYTYSPSEPGENYKFAITDSTTIDYTMEGAQPSRLHTIKKLPTGQFLITRSNAWQGKILKINMIDQKKGIAVFTFAPTKYIKSAHKLLMVCAEKSCAFKTIVNFCATQKVLEFDFDTIDFASLEK